MLSLDTLPFWIALWIHTLGYDLQWWNFTGLSSVRVTLLGRSSMRWCCCICMWWWWWCTRAPVLEPILPSSHSQVQWPIIFSFPAPQQQVTEDAAAPEAATTVVLPLSGARGLMRGTSTTLHCRPSRPESASTSVWHIQASQTDPHLTNPSPMGLAALLTKVLHRQPYHTFGTDPPHDASHKI